MTTFQMLANVSWNGNNSKIFTTSRRRIHSLITISTKIKNNKTHQTPVQVDKIFYVLLAFSFGGKLVYSACIWQKGEENKIYLFIRWVCVCLYVVLSKYCAEPKNNVYSRVFSRSRFCFYPQKEVFLLCWQTDTPEKCH